MDRALSTDASLTNLCFSLYSHIRISGTQVIPIPLFHSLDGTRSEDYVARVEPSASGGRKMAELLLDAIHNNARDNNARPGAPTTSLIDRSA